MKILNLAQDKINETIKYWNFSYLDWNN